MDRADLEAAMHALVVDYLEDTGDYAGAADLLCRHLVATAVPTGCDLLVLRDRLYERMVHARAMYDWQRRSGGQAGT